MITKKDKKNYTRFRNNILKCGFQMYQFSIYIRHCLSDSNAQTQIKRVKTGLPPKGKVGIMTVSDNQFENIEIYNGPDKEEAQLPPRQLEMF